MIEHQNTSYRILYWGALVVIMLLLCACSAPQTYTSSPEPSTKPTQSPSVPTVTATQSSPQPSPTLTRTQGPSPTSTALPPLAQRRWQTNGLIIEAARLITDPLGFFSYTPVFILYGDGQLIVRECEANVCEYRQGQLDEIALCQLINAIDRTGFLNADPDAFQLPTGTDNTFRLSVAVDQENIVTLPNLEQWIESPNWYAAYAGCTNCYPEPIIDPAFIDLFNLLRSYDTSSLTSYQSTRLAVSITDPVIAGTPQVWPEELVPLTELVEGSTCDDSDHQHQAVILEGAQAQALAELLSSQNGLPPIFTDGENIWQVQSKWLLPHEMPQTCQSPAGIYPPSTGTLIAWHCKPEMGALPTQTPTITPTPSITPTPLR